MTSQTDRPMLHSVTVKNSVRYFEASIEGVRYQIPELWSIGYCTKNDATVEDAVRYWHEQAQMEAQASRQPQIGDVIDVRILKPGAAKEIAANGWTCSHRECGAPVTTEVRFTRIARGLPGYSVGSHGTCDKHAKAHARSLRKNADD